MNNNDLFITSDLCLSAVLLCLGFRIEEIEKNQPKSSFLFKRMKGIDEAIRGFWAGELKLEPKSFFNCIKEIKSRLYQE